MKIFACICILFGALFVGAIFHPDFRSTSIPIPDHIGVSTRVPRMIALWPMTWLMGWPLIFLGLHVYHDVGDKKRKH